MNLSCSPAKAGAQFFIAQLLEGTGLLPPQENNR
jgi:hypothetical protein